MKNITSLLTITLAALTCITPLSSLAQDKAAPSTPGQEVVKSTSDPVPALTQEDINMLILGIGCKAPCFDKRVVGVSDNAQSSAKRSQTNGASVQYLIYNRPQFVQMGIDPVAMAQEVNNHTAAVASYFRLHPELKGMYESRLILYTGYKEPYQYDVSKFDEDKKEGFNLINQRVKDNSVCNKQELCSLLSLMYLNFTDLTAASSQSATPPHILDQKDFYSHLREQEKSPVQVYPSKKEDLNPFLIVIVMGTNGYKVSPQEANTITNSINSARKQDPEE